MLTLARCGGAKCVMAEIELPSEARMPVKDLAGPLLPTAEEKALLIDLQTRLGMPLPRRRGYRDEGGLEPEPAPYGPKPAPKTGGAETDIE